MNYTIELSNKAKHDIAYLKKSGNLVLYKKAAALIDEISENPYTGTGKPEKLKNNLSGMWSRRISGEHRLVYSVNENIVTINVISAKGHYGDK
jgi:toxin YoeB